MERGVGSANYSKEPQSVPTLSLLDVNGARELLARSDGRPIVLNLWATWCPPCQAEMPILAEAQANYQGIDIMFANQGETHDVVQNYLNLHHLQLKHALLDPGLVVSCNVSAGGYAYRTVVVGDNVLSMTSSIPNRWKPFVLTCTNLVIRLA